MHLQVTPKSKPKQVWSSGPVDAPAPTAPPGYAYGHHSGTNVRFSSRLTEEQY